ncbi:hypothetical protein DF3PB_600014 [uncultured Defluviicoccus sp.]|uniref:Uncharacterized protein n=1 Tax=metagenome TaxID=256318 RepID=A0A380TID6_9ZZZZ|nr:hypothetical protein DF3PB_600014 [uncultured Defluviicoccus sp.]
MTVAAVQRLLDRFSERPSVQYLEDAASLIQRLIDAHRMLNSGVSTSPLCARLSEGSFRD